jgi:F-type H+-transporting ATPase subunit alpha
VTGIAEIDGLPKAEMMEMVVFETEAGKSLADTLGSESALLGLVLNLEEDTVKVVVLGESHRIKEGMRVHRTKKLLSIPVGPDIVGRVVSPLGAPIDGKGCDEGGSQYAN